MQLTATDRKGVLQALLDQVRSGPPVHVPWSTLRELFPAVSPPHPLEVFAQSLDGKDPNALGHGISTEEQFGHWVAENRLLVVSSGDGRLFTLRPRG